MADRIPVSTHLILYLCYIRPVTYVTLVLSEKPEAETQFIQQLKAMADRIPVSTRHLTLLCMLHKACYICYISSQRKPRQKHSLYNSLKQ